MSRRSAGLLFAAAILTAVVAGVSLRDTMGYAVRQPDGSFMGDLTHYVYWTRLVTLGGIQDAYRGTWPETYAVYPPVTLYGFQMVGDAYRALVDPTFDPVRAQESLWLRAAIKLTALAWHLAAAAAIFWLVRRATDTRLAAIAGGLYVANPAALFDVAHWGQPDGAHSLFSVMAVGLVELGVPLGGWAAMALATLAKPQAVAILPLMLLGTWRAAGARSLIRGMGVGAGVGVLVILPFVVEGRLGQLLTLPGTISGVMPVVSANAHNLWWLVLQARGLDPLFTPDFTRFVGPFSYRTVAAGLVAGQFLFTYWLFWSGRARLAEAAALGALGWFTLTTQAHENHLFFVLPLLSLAWPRRRELLLPGLVLTVTVLMNMALHDEVLLSALGLGVRDAAVQALRGANAGANVLAFCAWSAVAVVRKPVVATAPAAAKADSAPVSVVASRLG